MKLYFSLLLSFVASFLFAQTPELIIPRGHAENVSTIAVSPDNKLLASGSWDKTVKLWDIASGKELKTLGNFPSWVKSIAFSPDGKKLATGCSKELRINDISAGGKEIFKQAVHTDDIDALTFSADGELLATVSEIENPDKNGNLFEVKIWEVDKMDLVGRVIAKGRIANLRFINTNELIGIGGTQIFHIDVNAGKVTQTEEFVTGISKLSPDGRWIVKDDYDSKPAESDDLEDMNLFSGGRATLEITDRETKQSVHKFTGQKSSIKTIAFSPDSRYVVTGADDNTIFIYDLINMKFAGKFTDKMSYPAGLTFTPDGKKLVSGNYDKMIRIWNFEEQKLIQKLGGVANVIYNIALSPNGQSLAVMGTPGFGGSGAIQVLDLKRGAVVKRFEDGTLGTTVQYSPDGKYLIAGSFGKGMGVWNTNSSAQLQVFASQKKATAFAISPDSKIMASSNNDASVPELLIQSFPGGNIINSYRLPHNIDAIAFAPDARSVYVGFTTDDKTFRIDIATGKTLQTFRHAGEYNSVTGIRKLLLNKDGSVLMTADDYGRVRWWNTVTGKETAESSVQRGRINGMIMMPGSKQMITCGGESAFADTTIKFTDILTRKVAQTLNGHSNSPSSIAVNSEGTFLFSGSYDRTVKLWDISTGKALATMVFFGGTDWVVVDKAGRFDGTEEGMKKMYYVKGLEVMPLESAYEQFYTPNLLPRIMEGEKFTPPAVDVNTLKAAPTVKISITDQQRNLSVEDDIASYNSDKEQVTLKVQADCPSDGVTEIRLFQNGKLVETTRNLVVEDDNTSEKSVVKTFTVKLNQGANNFKAIAFNTQRTESKPAELTINYIPAKNAEPQFAGITLHLMVVGINNYKNSKYTLNYAKADATSFKEQLEKSNAVFSKVNVHFITDADALKANIEATFKKVAKEAKPQDLFIFYYAGHGVMSMEAKNKEFYIVPYDVTQLYGAEDALAQKGISGSELQEFSKNIPAQKQLFILDACQSAGALDAVAMRGAAEEKAVAQLARSTGTHWLTASGSEQFATEFSQLGHGVFTYALLMGLQGAADNGDGQITVNELKAYLEVAVPELTKKYKGTEQYPSSYGFGNDFPLEVVPPAPKGE